MAGVRDFPNYPMNTYVICGVDTQDLMKNMVRVPEVLLPNSQNQLGEEPPNLKFVICWLSLRLTFLVL